MHIQLYSQGGKGTHRFPIIDQDVDRPTAQEMLTYIRRQGQNNLTEKELVGFFDAVRNG